MMATEATNENLANASNKIPELTTANNSRQDVDASDLLQANGDGISDDIKSFSEGIDSSINSAEVSINGGSDTEAARSESSKVTADSHGHVRTTSTLKKPASFKAVSVNKTFLAAKGATSTAVVKPGEKGPTGSSSPTPPATLSVRPRLVAKLGSGLRESVPRTSATANGGVSAAPDASVVWNKNRPPPPPEQKRITDEELKQQYGIHLATRLQSDDPGRQANWADIDDDDDDWAPESIEWTDGTKISLPSAEESAQAFSKPVPSPIVNAATTTEAAKPKSPAPTGLGSAVKLGGMSGTSGRGLILKGVSDKPTLVAKAPGPPTPVKSPWAPLPPVDKVAPVAIEVQQSQPQPHTRFGQRDPHGFDAMPPAKEIAADDFSRTWRDGNSNASRELYNSQSGRYEPVNDNRRNSSKNDGHLKQPALLQRPPQDQQGPAEPSAAFQTHRATGQDGSFGRRRASSNLSGGSGSLARRMSKGQDMHPLPDISGGRRGSLVAVNDEPSQRAFSPSAPHGGQRIGSNHHQPPYAHASPVFSHPSPSSTQDQSVQSTNPLESDVELQKKIMRESREQARKRRLEQEAKEEAERKERIRLKLEAMGPAPESNKAKKEAVKENDVVPAPVQPREIVSTAISPPKPPVPEVAGEIKQYGMMKVHHPEPITSSSVPFTGDERSALLDSRPNGLQPNVTTSDDLSHLPKSWQGSSAAPERMPNWGTPTSNSGQGRNVWGPPNSDKTLGNGTFNPDLSRLPEVHPQQMPSSKLNPIGPPGANNRSQVPYATRGRDQYGQKPAPIGPPARNTPHGTVHHDSRLNQATAAWANLPTELAREDAQARKEQGRRDAAHRELQASGNVDMSGTVYKDTWKQVAINEDGARSGVIAISEKIDEGIPISAATAWNSLPAQFEHAENARNSQLGTQGRNDGSPSSTPAFKDGWRQGQFQENGGRGESLGLGVNSGHVPNSSSQAIRGSRFFPNRDVRLEDMGSTFTRPGSPSPPPPTMAGHPAYDGDVLHPHVALPPLPIIVKLPPPQVLAPIAPPKPASFAAAVATPAAPQAPLLPPLTQSRPQDAKFKHQGDWQDRINSLMGRKPSPPKPHALAVDSSSKSALELPSQFSGATVSLPSSFEAIGSNDGSTYETKPLAEECFEEQEMGSTPTVRVPKKEPEAARHLAPPQLKPLPRKFLIADSITVDELKAYTPNSINIHFPGMSKGIILPYKPERQKSNPRKSTRGGSSSRHQSSSHRGGRNRESPSSYSLPLPEQSSPTPRSLGRGRGGAYTPSWTQRHASNSNSAINA